MMDGQELDQIDESEDDSDEASDVQTSAGVSSAGVVAEEPVEPPPTEFALAHVEELLKQAGQLYYIE